MVSIEENECFLFIIYSASQPWSQPRLLPGLNRQFQSNLRLIWKNKILHKLWQKNRNIICATFNKHSLVRKIKGKAAKLSMVIDDSRLPFFLLFILHILLTRFYGTKVQKIWRQRILQEIFKYLHYILPNCVEPHKKRIYVYINDDKLYWWPLTCTVYSPIRFAFWIWLIIKVN